MLCVGGAGNVANVEVLPIPIPIANERNTVMKEASVSFKCGNVVKIAAIVVPWLCAVALPMLRLEGFALSVGRCIFFECVMLPFGNIAMLGLIVGAHGLMWWANALFAFAGIIAPLAIALLFALCWRRWQFVLVWLGYVVLIVWDALIASFLASLIAEGEIVL